MVVRVRAECVSAKRKGQRLAPIGCPKVTKVAACHGAMAWRTTTDRDWLKRVEMGVITGMNATSK